MLRTHGFVCGMLLVLLYNPTASAISVIFNGKEYSTLGQTVLPTQTSIGCQSDYLPLPDGWQISEPSQDAQDVTKAYDWGTHVLTVNGAWYGTANYDGGCGGGCENIYTSTLPGGVTGYKPIGCSLRILIERGGPAVDANVCTEADRETCSPHAMCEKDNGQVICECPEGFTGNGIVCDDIPECLDDAHYSNCDTLAYCTESPGSFTCECPDGFLGDGFTCSNDAFGVRTVLNIPNVGNFDPIQLNILKQQYASVVMGQVMAQNSTMVVTMPIALGNTNFGERLLGITEGDLSQNQISLIALFNTKTEADDALAALTNPDWSPLSATLEDGPSVYRWTGGSTSDPAEIAPTGLTVDSVVFNPTCMSTGCWVIDVTYTVGVDDFSVFYLPKAVGSDVLSYDPIYTAQDGIWLISPADTFLPINHPCTTADYDASSSDLPASISACCIPEFLAMYRPVTTFSGALGTSGVDLSMCGTGDRVRGVPRGSVSSFAKEGQAPDNTRTFPQPVAAGDIGSRGIFVDGEFAGMAESRIDHASIKNSYVRIYTATLQLDEVELRTLAGQLRGTVGVEHTVDTFVGLAGFSPTGSHVLDTFAVQVNIHLEKTSFFTVSTHGTNDYTFLEYVNMRLVTVYLEDTNLADEAGESSQDFIETPSAASADYVQVTFTLGSKYEINANSALIPTSSVRAGSGQFFSDADLVHRCQQYADGNFPAQATFDDRFTEQDCSPGATMCDSPAAIPDSFVAYNIPLGIDYFPAAASDLSANIFVDMVVSATVKEADRQNDPLPNAGGDPYQMKTTLTASIPVVEGGVNIFCDGLVSKTDLKDVANADLIVGSASSAAELTRLRINTNIASTQLAPEDAAVVDSDSIEAGLMTLVLTGQSSYFSTNAGTRGVSIELEDVITIHIMQADGAGDEADLVDDVFALLEEPGADNSFADGLDVDGYALNGAFFFTIDRAAQRAHLEPSEGLLSICPFNPARPSQDAELETCVTRRDVRYRNYPARPGSVSTAMELCASVVDTAGFQCTLTSGVGYDSSECCAQSTSSSEADFFTTIFSDNSFARQLAVDFANVVADAYELNGRYRRAYWINPGYEWTPTQTGGTAIFSVSQKLFMFALITLDEGIADVDGQQLSAAGPTFSRRRMLLQSSPEQGLTDAQAGVGGNLLTFDTTPTSMMAKAFEVPEDRVATFSATLQLTEAQACMDARALQAELRETLDQAVQGSISQYRTLQVTSLSVDRAGVVCARRAAPARALRSFSAATADVTMLVVFEAGTASQINVAAISETEGVEAFEPLRVSPKVATSVQGTVFTPAPESDGSSLPLIPIICGVVGAAVVLLAVGAVLYMRGREPKEEAVVVQSVNVADLKAQLDNEV